MSIGVLVKYIRNKELFQFERYIYTQVRINKNSSIRCRHTVKTHRATEMFVEKVELVTEKNQQSQTRQIKFRKKSFCKTSANERYKKSCTPNQVKFYVLK